MGASWLPWGKKGCSSSSGGDDYIASIGGKGMILTDKQRSTIWGWESVGGVEGSLDGSGGVGGRGGGLDRDVLLQYLRRGCASWGSQF